MCNEYRKIEGHARLLHSAAKVSSQLNAGFASTEGVIIDDKKSKKQEREETVIDQ